MRLHFFNVRNVTFNDDDPGSPCMSLDVEIIDDSGRKIIEEMYIEPNEWTTTSDEFNEALNHYSHDDYDDASDSLNSVFEKIAGFLQNISLTEIEINEILDREGERD